MEPGWLKQSLREASEATKQIPAWARELLEAHESQYGPQSSRRHRAESPLTKPIEQNDSNTVDPQNR